MYIIVLILLICGEHLEGNAEEVFVRPVRRLFNESGLIAFFEVFDHLLKLIGITQAESIDDEVGYACS